MLHSFLVEPSDQLSFSPCSLRARKMAKRIAVIGGGCSGLTATKCCLDEGLEPVCFERTDEIGGLWKYTMHVKDGQACVMRSTVINTSKEMMCFSDYPIPKHYPNFMHNSHVWQYFKDYAKHFGLTDYVRYNTEVVMVKRAEDFSKTGRWNIECMLLRREVCI